MLDFHIVIALRLELQAGNLVGLFRVHQFSKVEMFAFTHPDQSEEMHQKMLAIEEQIYQDLGIPYQVVNICSGDLGGPAYRKYDLEA